MTGSQEKSRWQCKPCFMEKLWWSQWVFLVMLLCIKFAFVLSLFHFFLLLINMLKFPLFRSDKCFKLGWPMDRKSDFFVHSDESSRAHSVCWDFRNFKDSIPQINMQQCPKNHILIYKVFINLMSPYNLENDLNISLKLSSWHVTTEAQPSSIGKEEA